MKKFDRTVGSPISREECKKLTDHYAKRFPHETKFAIFGRDAIEKLLSEFKGCEGIKITFGANEEGQIKPILSAVDANAATIAKSELNASVLCPPHCASSEIEQLPE